MIDILKNKLAELTDFDVRASFYQAGLAVAGPIIYIEPHESTAEIKSGANPEYAEALYFRLIVGVPCKGNPDAPQQLIDAVRVVRSKLWAGERAPDKVSWMNAFSFKEFESCKFIRPEANESKALAVLTLEIKNRVAI